MIVLHLPYPPSVNKAYRNVPGKGRVKTRAYRNWQDDAAVAARQQCKNERIGGPFKTQIVLCKPDKRRRDLDNSLKTVLDFLCAEGFIDDDSLCQEINIKWGGTTPGALVKLEKAA